MNQRQTGIPAELTRSEAINQAHPAAHVAQRQGLLNTAAAGLSRRGIMAAKAELANQALLTLVNVLYEADTDGKPANVDPHDGRIMVPVPWGRMGCRRWGLRASEGRALRWIVFNRTAAVSVRPLLDYDAGARHWYLNLRTYPVLRPALVYLQNNPVTVDEWRQAWRATRSAWAAKKLGAE
jgi:hypothetical protein